MQNSENSISNPAMKLKFFVVFHHNLENIYSENLVDYFEFISVNDLIPKNIKNQNLKIIKESSLSGYVDYQSLKYNESSVMINLENYIQESDIDYLCFLQYDNLVNENYINFIKKNISSENCICPWLMSGKELLESSLPNMFPYFNKIIEFYNSFYNTNHTIEKLGGPIISTFILHRNIYFEMINFYKKTESQIVKDYINKYGTRHIAGFLERFWAIFLNLRLGGNIIHNSDGFLYLTEVKDIQHQLWRYQS